MKRTRAAVKRQRGTGKGQSLHPVIFVDGAPVSGGLARCWCPALPRRKTRGHEYMPVAPNATQNKEAAKRELRGLGTGPVLVGRANQYCTVSSRHCGAGGGKFCWRY